MRILYFTRDYSPHDHRFLTALAATPHEIYSLRLERRGRALEDRALPPQVQQVSWRGGSAPFAWKQAPALAWDLRRVLRELKPDVVHAGPVQTCAWLAGWARRGLRGQGGGRMGLTAMSWGSDLLRDADANGWMRYLTRQSLASADTLVGDCDAVRRKARAFGFAPERVFLFPWGIDLQRFQPGQPRPADGCFNLLALRAWEPLYGTLELVRAFCRAAQAEPRLRLLLLGGGSQAAQIRREIESAGLAERVTLPGQITNDDLPRYYHLADVYLSASHSDGSSVSLMEALACGLPALVSDIPGNREWVEPGKHGWLFPVADEAALAEGMLRAANLAPDERTRMARAARELAEARADWNQNFPVLLDAYQAALEPKKH